MSTETILPGDVTPVSPAPPGSTPPVINGASNQWADGSDSTWAELFRPAGQPAGVQADLAPMVANPSRVTAISLVVRGYGSPDTTGLGLLPYVEVRPNISGTAMFTFGSGIGVSFTGSMSTIQYDYPDDYWGGSWPLSAVASALAAGAYVFARAEDTDTFTIAELSVMVTLSGSPAPLRIYPRSSTRLYPRRNTRRPGTF